MEVANDYLTLRSSENQAAGIAQYAIDFVQGRFQQPEAEVFAKLDQFHADSVACAVAALACRMRAPVLLRDEALEYAVATPQHGAGRCFGSASWVRPEKAVLANCAAVRELDANVTNFGYNPRTGQTRGEFGHNDFYPVVVAAARQARLDGQRAALGMLCLDEIRGRLAEAFALKNHKIDHVMHGAIASAAVYGALLGASVEQIESAIGMVVAHFVPFRAIRAGHQLSDSKGASAAISTEMAITSVHRALRGFVGPRDVLRNPQALFCLFEPPAEPDRSPFDLTLATSGSDFAIMRMHFKLGMYEHQSAGAIQGTLHLLQQYPALAKSLDELESMRITIYEPAFGIIGDPAKRDPHNRQSADHSMLYIIATLLRKAHESGRAGWSELMLLPADYNDASIFHPLTRAIMSKIDFRHGGPDYDRRYPEGIPTTVEVQHRRLGKLSSGLVMYPLGHAGNESPELSVLLNQKFQSMASLGTEDTDALYRRLVPLVRKTPNELLELYSFPILMGDGAS